MGRYGRLARGAAYGTVMVKNGPLGDSGRARREGGPSCRGRTGCSRGEAADRWAASEGRVAAGSVVVLEPGVQGGGALVVGRPGGGVGPFGLQGAVEPFGLAVGPW